MSRLPRPAAWLTFGVVLVAIVLVALRRLPNALPALGLRPHAQPLAIVKANPDVRHIAQADTDFGFRLLARLAPDKGHPNVFFSPFSLAQALSMTWNGAGGATQRDMAATLGLTGLAPGKVNAANGLFLPSLENPDPQVELSVANALWIKQDLTFNPTFQQTCRQFYGADTTSLDFGSPGAADTINGWVKDHTRGKIDQIVSSGDLASATAVLTDAVYFHGKWAKPFDTSQTHDAPFTLADGSTKPVPLMTQEDEFSYLETPTFQAVRLPYGQGRLAMYVFLLKSKTGLDAFCQTITAAQWGKRVAKMHPTELTLSLPRFHADDQWTLNDPLSQMGMASAFGPGADFSPMGLPGSYIQAVIHKATLDVDEEGTVATAVTGAYTATASIVSPPMRVDHPFLCVIQDDATGTILFLGAIRDPQKIAP